jgi:hypothetical protein
MAIWNTKGSGTKIWRWVIQNLVTRYEWIELPYYPVFNIADTGTSDSTMRVVV